MPVIRFPDPRKAGPEGLVAVGGDLHPDSLVLAYRHGIFPWPVEDLPILTWFCPLERGILVFKELHIPKSLEKAGKRASYRFSFDQAFERVIRQCSKVPRAGQSGTWITGEILDAYCKLHEMGYAHSCEVWEGNELVGGVYGVEVDGVFAGESMFHLKPNASKLALLHLFEHLESRGADWMDIQMVTPHMLGLGARAIPRAEFLDRLAQTRSRGLKLF